MLNKDKWESSENKNVNDVSRSDFVEGEKLQELLGVFESGSESFQDLCTFAVEHTPAFESEFARVERIVQSDIKNIENLPRLKEEIQELLGIFHVKTNDDEVLELHRDITAKEREQRRIEEGYRQNAEAWKDMKSVKMFLDKLKLLSNEEQEVLRKIITKEDELSSIPDYGTLQPE